MRFLSIALIACVSLFLVGCDASSEEVGTSNTSETPLSLVYRDYNTDAFSKLDLTTRKSSDYFPVGYDLVSDADFGQQAQFVVLRNGNEVVLFDVKENEITHTILTDAKPSEMVVAMHSITDRSKIHLSILDTVEEPGMFGYEVVGVRANFFDAASKTLTDAPTVRDLAINDYSRCYEYDSKHSRFFMWQCSEGIGSSGPVKTYDLESQETKVVVGVEMCSTRVSNGVVSRGGKLLVYTRPHKSLDEKEMSITVVTPNAEVSQDTYTYSTSVVKEISPYSAYFIPNHNLFAIGGANTIQFLRFDDKKRITEQVNIPAQSGYLNYMFHDDNTLYIEVADAVWLIDLATLQVKNSIRLKGETDLVMSIN